MKTSGDAAADDARDTLLGVQDIVDDLPEQLAKTKPLVNNVVATNRDINLARTQGKITGPVYEILVLVTFS